MLPTYFYSPFPPLSTHTQSMMQEFQRNPELMRQMMAMQGGAGGGGAGGGAMGGMQGMLAQNPELLAQMMQVTAQRQCSKRKVKVCVSLNLIFSRLWCSRACSK